MSVSYTHLSKATTLSRFELTYLLSKMNVAEIMEKNVITIKPDIPIEEAALIMKKNKVGGLPVVEETRVVGMITESDIFDVLVETLGVELGGTRITLELPEKPGELHRVTGKMCIRDRSGGMIPSVEDTLKRVRDILGK